MRYSTPTGPAGTMYSRQYHGIAPRVDAVRRPGLVLWARSGLGPTSIPRIFEHGPLSKRLVPNRSVGVSEESLCQPAFVRFRSGSGILAARLSNAAHDSKFGPFRRHGPRPCQARTLRSTILWCSAGAPSSAYFSGTCSRSERSVLAPVVTKGPWLHSSCRAVRYLANIH